MSRHASSTILALALGSVLPIVACHHAAQARTSPAARDADTAAAPTIESIRPDSVVVPRGAVVEVVVLGRGFVPGPVGFNTIQFDGVRLTDVPANAAGTELRFAVPDVVVGGEAPPRPLETGTYSLRVATQRGTSNSMTIRVFRE